MGLESWDNHKLGLTRDRTGISSTTIDASTAETTIVSAESGVYNDICMVIVTNTSAATNTRIDFRDTTGGAVKFSLMSYGGQAPVGFSPPVPVPQAAKNTNWTAQCSASTTDVRILVQYFRST
jgi:hypothetical protein